MVLGEAKAALITEYLEATEAAHLVWLPLYRVADFVYIQNHLLFYDQLDRPFVLQSPTVSLREREAHTAEGVAISEWQVHISDLERYIHDCELV